MQKASLADKIIETAHVFALPGVFPLWSAISRKPMILKERWPSGLRRTLGKRVYFNEYRGFESHSLRHTFKNL